MRTVSFFGSFMDEECVRLVFCRVGNRQSEENYTSVEGCQLFRRESINLSVM